MDEPGSTRFDALEVCLQMVKSLRVPLEKIRKRDANLYDQIRRAGTSAANNLAEGRRRRGQDREHCWRVGAGSADEIRMSLRVGHAWGYVTTDDIAEPLELIDRVLAMAWRMTEAQGKHSNPGTVCGGRQR